MLFVRDKGRMCNNILQYAHVYAWAREHGRTSMSMRFAYKYPYFHICNTRYHNFFFYLLGKYGEKLGILKAVSFNEEEGDLRTKEAEILAHRHLIVEGWYARFYDLFLKYKTDIRRLFSFHDGIEHRVENVLRQGMGTIKLGVHVRRGDYARWQGGKYLYSDEQFIAIIRQFIGVHTDEKVSIWVCGNDPKLDKQAYEKAFGMENVHFPDGNPGEDLCLLSHCDYLIGAPSTFTLTASMYHDAPLYWIMDAKAPVTNESFGQFDDLFQHIL